MKRTIKDINTMKNKRKLLVLVTLIFTIVFNTSAQSFDEERMNRDLKIAENILSTLASGEGRVKIFNNVESNYIPEFGVVFSIPQSSYVYAVSGSGNVVYSTGSGASAYVIASDRDDDEDAVTEIKVREEIKADEIAKQGEQKVRDLMTTFLVDYADLIGQLNSSHKIVVQSKGKNERFFVGGQNASKMSELSAQLSKGDLITYKQGKIDRDELIKRIEFNSNANSEVSRDLELFATIFSRLYEPDLSSTYYMSSRNVGYTKLDGLGVTFNMKFYSSTSDRGKHTIRTTGESGLTQEERDQKVDAMYPIFEKSFLENILDYGRTVKSLKDDEMLMFKVRLTECKGCEMPKEIEVSVKSGTLKKYDNGSLSKEKALKEITVKRK
ncbi:hypothetical protein [Ekhidna sp.]|uniref:hypothetical protein n=1 Tax=Ekhidna sp. TaxID=2608089 RepID=UPI003B50FA71